MEEVVGGPRTVSGSLGIGHVISWHSSGQNSRILLKRYHCRFELSADGVHGRFVIIPLVDT